MKMKAMKKNKKQIRSEFRRKCYVRDGYRCAVCGLKSSPAKAGDDLDVHHITDRSKMPNGGYVKENGICLCSDRSENQLNCCHLKAEQFHIKNVSIPGYSPEELYVKIGSSYDAAVVASEKLNV